MHALTKRRSYTEEDFIKCLRPTYIGDFSLKGRELRLKGQNRIGNLVVENQNYCEFEDWLNVSTLFSVIKHTFLSFLGSQRNGEGILWCLYPRCTLGRGEGGVILYLPLVL